MTPDEAVAPAPEGSGVESQGTVSPGIESRRTASPATDSPVAPWSPPSLGDPPASILPDDPLAVAGRKAMWIHVQRLIEREPGLRDPERTDDLRKYRVATRRLRAAMRLLRDAYERKELRRLEKGSRSIARAVGTVRDLDVRIADVERWAERRGDPNAGAELAAWWRERRTEAAAQLTTRLDGRRHRRWVLDLVAFVESDGDAADFAPGPVTSREDGAATVLPTTVRDRAGSRIWDAFERVRAFEPFVAEADVTTLHALRIEVKRLRYSLEFFSAVLGAETPALLERLVGLQDHLGALNDAVVATAAVHAFLEGPGHDLPDAEMRLVLAYLEDRDAEIVALRRSVGGAWSEVSGTAFARGLGTAVVIG